MFGPFPDWSMQEGQYRCKLFSMRYLIDGETGLRDRNKSWIAVLYCDEKLPCRYMLKFSIRKRSQKGGAWQEMDKGSVSFEVRDGNVQSVGQAGNCHPKSTIDIAVREDSETQRYIQMRMSDGKHNDELRFGIDVGEAVKRL